MCRGWVIYIGAILYWKRGEEGGRGTHVAHMLMIDPREHTRKQPFPDIVLANSATTTQCGCDGALTCSAGTRERRT